MPQPVKIYEQDLVREIMISTALCVQDLLREDPHATQDDVIEYVARNFSHIIRETVSAEQERMRDEPSEEG